MTGRDIEQKNLVIKMDWKSHHWQRIGSVEDQIAAQAREQYEEDPAVRTIRALMIDNPAGFELSASDFFTEMGRLVGEYGALTPATLGKHFQKIAPQLLRHDGILHKFARTSKKKCHGFAPKGAQQSIDVLPSHPSLPSQPS